LVTKRYKKHPPSLKIRRTGEEKLDTNKHEWTQIYFTAENAENAEILDTDLHGINTVFYFGLAEGKATTDSAFAKDTADRRRKISREFG
jgi:hypothetical protein